MGDHPRHDIPLRLLSRVSFLTPIPMSTFNQIQTACGALGYFDSKTYLKDDDCEGTLPHP